jgi:hypothetical protein
MHNKKVEFTPPQNVNLPEGAMDGDEFDLVCMFKREGAKVCMTKFGDAAMPGYDEGEHSVPQAKPSYKDYAGGIAGQMGGQPA